MTENRMPCWYFSKEELENTPSFQDNIDSKTETIYRSDAAEFISNLANSLGLPCETCATGMVLFHRFFLFHSFKTNAKYLVAACCLYLAGKIEETPKKYHDIIEKSKYILDKADFIDFGADPKASILSTEKVLLKTVKFDFNITHPYKFLLTFAKKLKDKKELVESLLQESWAFVNNSFRTNLCLKWEPEIIACSAIYLASKLNNHNITSWENQKPDEKWWDNFVEGMTVEVMEDVCHKILDEVVYRKTKAESSKNASSIKSNNSKNNLSLNSLSSTRPSSTSSTPSGNSHSSYHSHPYRSSTEKPSSNIHRKHMVEKKHRHHRD